MRILYLNDDWPPAAMGGAAIVAFNLAREVARRGHEVGVITTVRNRNEERILEEEKMKVYRICTAYNWRWRAWRSLYNPQTVGKVRKIIREFKPEVVHAHNVHLYLSYYCLKIAKKSGAKVYLTAHDVMSFSYEKLKTKKFLEEGDCKLNWFDRLKQARKRFNPFREIIIRHYLGYVDKIIAVSRALKEALKQNGIGNVKVIYNGIDVREWETEEEEVNRLKRVNNLEGKRIVLFGGRLSEAKGGGNIILAMDKVIKKIPKAVLVVLGERNQYALEMDALIKNMNIGDNIIFTGWLSGSSLKAIYYISDIVCTPSLYLDPFPTVNLEAMACARPVVGTCFGGTKELVENGKSGYIVDPRDINNMADKIVNLLEDRKKAESFGFYGRERVKKRFNLNNNLDFMLNIFLK